MSLGAGGKPLFNGYRAFVGNDEKGLGIDIGDSYATLGMYLKPQNCTLMVKMINTLLCIFCHNKKEREEGMFSRPQKVHTGRGGFSFFTVTPGPATAICDREGRRLRNKTDSLG